MNVKFEEGMSSNSISYTMAPGRIRANLEYRILFSSSLIRFLKLTRDCTEYHYLPMRMLPVCKIGRED